MSTGKRLAKRSIIGTRVCAKGEDGFYYSGLIAAVKTPGNTNQETRYTVRFDAQAAGKPGISSKREYRDVELIGSGFQTIQGVTLLPQQKVYITFNGREISGQVVAHHKPPVDEVIVSVSPPGSEVVGQTLVENSQGLIEVRKKLEEVRLTECRKSARLQDQQDTDYSRLADMAGDRRRLSSHYIDVPHSHGSRKRRPSSSQDDGKEDVMDECTAALVLMHLSHSPHSPNNWIEPLSPAPSPSDACSWRSNTPSPPLSEGVTNWFSASDEGIVLDDDFDELPKKKKATNRRVYQCTWKGCGIRANTVSTIEAHVRKAHLGNENDEGMESDDHEEIFYYTEVEVGVTSPPPTLSHRDMARPPHEGRESPKERPPSKEPSAQTPMCFPDPEYQKALGHSGHHVAGPMSIPNHSYSWSMPSTISPGQKQMKLSVSAPTGKLPGSPSRRIRGDTKKCRKVYGMDHRELWCTQCKWKKACTRFGD